MSIRPYRGRWPHLGERVYVDAAAVIIGDVVLGEDSSVWPCAVIRGDVASIRIGARTSVQDGAILHVTHDSPVNPGGRNLVIGDDVTIGHSAVLHACTVGTACLIGMNATVLDGVVLEDEVMVAAGALVPPGKRLTSGTLWAGNPAREVRALSSDQIAYLRYSARHYVTVKDEFLRGQPGSETQPRSPNA